MPLLKINQFFFQYSCLTRRTYVRMSHNKPLILTNHKLELGRLRYRGITHSTNA